MTLNRLIKDVSFSRDYKKGLISTLRIENFPIWREQTYDMLTYHTEKIMSHEDMKWHTDNIIILLVSRVDEFKELWGRQDFVFMGEFQMYAWVVECNGCEAIIFSGKGKGTTVEIILDEHDEPKGSVEDLFFAYKELMQSFPSKR